MHRGPDDTLSENTDIKLLGEIIEHSDFILNTTRTLSTLEDQQMHNQQENAIKN